MHRGKRTKFKIYFTLENFLQNSAILQECGFQQEVGIGRDEYQKNEKKEEHKDK